MSKGLVNAKTESKSSDSFQNNFEVTAPFFHQETQPGFFAQLEQPLSLIPQSKASSQSFDSQSVSINISSQENTDDNRSSTEDSWFGNIVDKTAELVGDATDFLDFSFDGFRDRLADFINKNIPAYAMLSVMIGYDIVRGENVSRTMDNVFKGIFSLLNPIGSRLYELIKQNKIVNEVYHWVNKELISLGLTKSDIVKKFNYFLDNITLKTLHPIDDNIGLFNNTFGSIFKNILSFIDASGNQIFGMIKKSFQHILVNLAQKLGGYDLLCNLLGYDIITQESRDASTTDILRGIMKLPIVQAMGGNKLWAKIEEFKLIEKTTNWVRGQWELIKGGYTDLIHLKDKFILGFKMETLAAPLDFVMSMKNEVVGFLTKTTTFFINIANVALKFIKIAMIWTLKKYANDQIYGFEMVKVLLGKDPFTEESYPRTPENIICAFLKLLPNGVALSEKLKETGAIQKATDWIMGAIEEFISILNSTKQAFLNLWKTSTIEDLFEPIDFFMKIVVLFTEPVLKLVAFVKRVLTKIFEILLRIMQFPADMAKQVIENIKLAFEDIRKDPIGFLLKLLGAVKEGFSRFFGNIGKHLLAGVSGWLFGQVAKVGISPPKDFSLSSILGFVMDVLGLTVDKLWERLAKKIGQDKVDKIKGGIDKLKGAWLFIKDVMENGVSAVWKYIQEKISNLWNIVLEEVKSWIITKIIQKVVTKLISMLDPTGVMAVINGFIAFFKAIQSFIEYFKQMLEIVNTFVQGMAEIAKGVISKAAVFLENGLAKALPVAIGFLANQVGLGKIGTKIRTIIGKVRGVIDNALDWLIEKAVKGIQSVLGLFGKGKSNEKSEKEEKEVYADDASEKEPKDNLLLLEKMKVPFSMMDESHSLYIEKVGSGYELKMASGVGKRLLHLIQKALNEIGNNEAEKMINLRNRLIDLKGDVMAINADLKLLTKSKKGLVDDWKTIPGLKLNLEDCAKKLKTIGNGSKLTSLENIQHLSKYVDLNWQIKSKYLSKNKKGKKKKSIRDIFYPGSKATKKYKDKRVNAKVDPNNKDRFLSDAIFSEEEKSDKNKSDPDFESIVDGIPFPSIHKYDATVDHDPPVSVHWNKKGGNNTTQEKRARWYVDPKQAGLKVISRSLNSKKDDDENYLPDVKEDFRGPDDYKES